MKEGINELICELVGLIHIKELSKKNEDAVKSVVSLAISVIKATKDNRLDHDELAILVKRCTRFLDKAIQAHADIHFNESDSSRIP